VADPYLRLLEKHREAVVHGLSRASPSARTAFAASCAEVLYPLWLQYGHAVGEPDEGVIRAALDACWEWAAGDANRGVDPADLADEVAGLAPRSDESPSKLAPWAQNAALATAAALDAWAGAALDRVAAASDRVVESLDYVADPGEPGDLEVVRTELDRQRRALAGDVASVRVEATESQVTAFIRGKWNQ
jgi:hypothetical protein